MLAREVAATAVAQRVSTMMVAFLAAAMCVTTLLTVGRAAAAEQQVAARLDAAGSRTLTVTDANEAGFLDGDVVGGGRWEPGARLAGDRGHPGRRGGDVGAVAPPG